MHPGDGGPVARSFLMTMRLPPLCRSPDGSKEQCCLYMIAKQHRLIPIDLIGGKEQSWVQLRKAVMSSDSAKPRVSLPADSGNLRAAQGRNQERRQFQRFPFNADAEVVESQSGAKIRGRVTDLSLAGCYVDTLSPFLASTAIHIKLVREAQVFEAEAKVTYCKLGRGMGVAFVSAQPEHKKLLGNWIVDLGGELPRASTSKSDGAKGMANDQLSRVVSELIGVLMRKGVLTETEKQEILRKIES
jgi:hypothetical protein